MIPARTAWILPLGMLLSVVSVGCRDKDPRVRIGQREWRVEIASDPDAIRKGLAGRTEIPQGTGMLFILDTEKVHYFYMKDCLVPIDVAFISARMRIVEIRTMRVEDDPAHPTCEYSSRFDCLYALEVAGGSLEAAGVKASDTVEFLGPAKDAAKAPR